MRKEIRKEIKKGMKNEMKKEMKEMKKEMKEMKRLMKVRSGMKEMKRVMKIRNSLNEVDELDLCKVFREVSDGIHMDTYSVDEITATGNVYDITVSNLEPTANLRIICSRGTNSRNVRIGITTPENVTFETYLNDEETTSFISLQDLICNYILNDPHNTDPFIITIYP